MEWRSFNVNACFCDRKYQDYVYIKWEYWITIQKIKHYLKNVNKVNENKVFLMCEFYMDANKIYSSSLSYDLN